MDQQLYRRYVRAARGARGTDRLLQRGAAAPGDKETPAARWQGGLGRGLGRVRTVLEGMDLGLLFAMHQERVVHSDGHVRFLGHPWAVSTPAASRVTVCWRPEEQLVILWDGHRVGGYTL